MPEACGKYFHFEEFTVSAEAERQGRPIVLPAEYRGNVERLVFDCLDPFRESIGRPIVVLSGYRPLWLNEFIGGSNTSAHMTGSAADIIVPGLDNIEVAAAFIALKVRFDQVILEFPPGGWVHIGIAPICRSQVLTALKVNGATKYYTGLVREHND
jgi:hypothetical protein